jgi:hypothetical protein
MSHYVTALKKYSKKFKIDTSATPAQCCRNTSAARGASNGLALAKSC